MSNSPNVVQIRLHRRPALQPTNCVCDTTVTLASVLGHTAHVTQQQLLGTRGLTQHQCTTCNPPSGSIQKFIGSVLSAVQQQSQSQVLLGATAHPLSQSILCGTLTGSNLQHPTSNFSTLPGSNLQHLTQSHSTCTQSMSQHAHISHVQVHSSATINQLSTRSLLVKIAAWLPATLVEWNQKCRRWHLRHHSKQHVTLTHSCTQACGQGQSPSRPQHTGSRAHPHPHPASTSSSVGQAVSCGHA
jgi:hypothetical protein